MSLTIAFQPPNRIGLGHISRLSAIASSLSSSTARTPFIVEGTSHLLLDAFGHPYLSLPSSHALYRGEAWAQWSPQERSNVDFIVNRAALNALNPSVVVFDTLPNPACAMACIERRTPMILCLRSVRDIASYVRGRRQILERCAKFIIPHEADEFPLPELLASRSVYVGNIVRPLTIPPRSIEGNEPRRVLVTGGGGGYPGTVDFYNFALEACRGVRRAIPTVEVCLLTGPLFSEWDRLRPDGARISFFAADPAICMGSVDLVVCQAGYNTVSELAVLGTPTIFIPAERTFDDQMRRATEFARGRSNAMVFGGPECRGLAELMITSLRGPTQYIASYPPPGARRAAEEVLRAL